MLEIKESINEMVNGKYSMSNIGRMTEGVISGVVLFHERYNKIDLQVFALL